MYLLRVSKLFSAVLVLLVPTLPRFYLGQPLPHLVKPSKRLGSTRGQRFRHCRLANSVLVGPTLPRFYSGQPIQAATFLLGPFCTTFSSLPSCPVMYPIGVSILGPTLPRFYLGQPLPRLLKPSKRLGSTIYRFYLGQPLPRLLKPSKRLGSTIYRALLHHLLQPSKLPVMCPLGVSKLRFGDSMDVNPSAYGYVWVSRRYPMVSDAGGYHKYYIVKKHSP